MTTTTSAWLSRARRGLGWRARHVRDTIEWQASRTLFGHGPWCRNRWGHRYRTMSLAEYHYLRDGNPETHEARLLERLLLPGMTVVDVGANHGLFSMEAAQHIGPTGRIHAFEPAPDTRATLEQNLRTNGLDRIARVVPAALGDAPGTASLRIYKSLTGLNSLAEHDITWNRRTLRADSIVEVPVTTLDIYADGQGLDRIDLVKIDVEGYELAVLRGARRLLSRHRIDWLMLEVGDLTCANARTDPESILAEMEDYGYALHAITPEGGLGDRMHSFPLGSFSANFLAFHPSSASVPIRVPRT